MYPAYIQEHFKKKEFRVDIKIRSEIYSCDAFDLGSKSYSLNFSVLNNIPPGTNIQLVVKVSHFPSLPAAHINVYSLHRRIF